MIEVCLGLIAGLTVGICAAPLWMMLQLPMRMADVLDARHDMKLCGWALALGASLGTLRASGFLPDLFGMAAMAVGGLFVGMLAAALAEAVEVVPVFFDRLSITADMRWAALAMALGKAIGVILAGLVS